jgi:hypothetical protein
MGDRRLTEAAVASPAAVSTGRSGTASQQADSPQKSRPLQLKTAIPRPWFSKSGTKRVAHFRGGGRVTALERANNPG